MHIHIEVFVNNRTVKTTQIAFPEEINNTVYGSGVYASKGQNPTKNTNDNVFSDGVTSEMTSLAGNTTSGYAATPGGRSAVALQIAEPPTPANQRHRGHISRTTAIQTR